MIVVRDMESAELERLRKLDVSEMGECVYQFVDGRLVKTPESWHRPRWDKDECRRRIDRISRRGWMIVHRCTRCGTTHRNRAALDDPTQPDALDVLIRVTCGIIKGNREEHR